MPRRLVQVLPSQDGALDHFSQQSDAFSDQGALRQLPICVMHEPRLCSRHKSVVITSEEGQSQIGRRILLRIEIKRQVWLRPAISWKMRVEHRFDWSVR